MEPTTHAFPVLCVHEDGHEEHPIPQLMRNTLFGALWGDEKATLLRVDLPKGEDAFERQEARLRLVTQLQGLPTDLRVLGSGNGLKKGKLWAADSRVVQWCRDRYFQTSEEALSYGALLFSENKALYKVDGAVIDDDERPDGQGLVDIEWLREQELPDRQIQIRAAWPGCLAKGTLKPTWGLRASTGKPMAMHPSMIKGRDQDISGPFLMGIRDIAERREFRSGWTLTQWLPESVRQRLWKRYAVDVLRALENAFTSPEGALRLLAASPRNGNNEARDLLHLLLHSGLEPSHPWLRTSLKKHVRRTYLDTALGLGLPLEGGMACWIGGLQENKVAVPWMPVGAELVIGRYPIRDAWSLQVVRNSVAPIPEGSIGMSAELARKLDADFDGDLVWVIQDPDVVEAVQRLHEQAPSRLERGAKQRKCTRLAGLERVAVEHMGATGIGSPTWLIAAALASDEAGYVPELSDQVQSAVESLKWSTEVDWERIREIEGVVKLPDFLELGQRKKTFLDEAPRIEFGGGFEPFWNACCEHWERHVLEGTKRLQDFRDRVPGPSSRHLSEVSIVRDFYSSAIQRSGGDEDQIRSAVQLVRGWGEGKTEDRDIWARTVWDVAHSSRHPKATASLAFHSFPNELAELLGLPEEEIEVALPPALPGLSVEVGPGALYVNERKVEFQPLTYQRSSNGKLQTTTVPIVGGWRWIQEQEGLTDAEALNRMRSLAEQLTGTPVPVQLRPESVEWNEDPVLLVYSGSQLLGSVPAEHTDRLRIHIMRALRALITMRSRTLYAVLVG